MGLSTSYSKAETEVKLTNIKQAFGSGINPKPLKIGDPVPTQYGGYILADVGDYGFGIAEPEKWNVAFLSAGGWEIISNPISQINNNAELINFSENIYFDKQSVAVATVNYPIQFKPYGTNAKILGSTFVRLTADGINTPDFSKFKKLSGSENYDNTAGVLNSIFFFYDGFDAWVNIWQGIGSSDIDYSDSTPPTAPTVAVSEIQDTSITLSWSGASDNVAVTSYEIYINNLLVNTASASPFTIAGLNHSTNYNIKLRAKDAAGNSSNFSNTLNITTLPSLINDIIFDDFQGATFNASTKVLSGNQNSGANYSNVINVSNNFELILETTSDSAILGITPSLSNLFGWIQPAQQDYLICIYKYQGVVYAARAVSNVMENIGQTNFSGNFMKIRKSGSNAICSTSVDGETWIDFYTASGVFSVSQVYIKGMFAVGTGLSLSGKFKN